METKPKRRPRVVLLSDGRRQRIQSSAGGVAVDEAEDCATPGNAAFTSNPFPLAELQCPSDASQPPDSSPLREKGRTPHLLHSTPLRPPPNDVRKTGYNHPHFPGFDEDLSSTFSSSSSSSSSRGDSSQLVAGGAPSSHSTQSACLPPAPLPQQKGSHNQHSPLSQHPPMGSKNRKKKKRSRIHPAPPPLLLSQTWSTSKHSPLPSSQQSQEIPSLPSEFLDHSLPPLLSRSLPPLPSSLLRKGGRRPSPSTDWSWDGQAELQQLLPDRQLRVFLVTWNMQEMKELPECLDDLLLPPTEEAAADVYVVGTQESSGQRREWELLIQQTLGPSHLLVSSSSLGVIYLLMFLRRDLLWYCSVVESVSHATRLGSMIKTKGGVGIQFTLFGSSFLFITSHFSAHTHRISERNSEMQRIADNLQPSRLERQTQNRQFDYIFWLGDLNYRVDLEREKVDTHLLNQDWMSLLLHDQLTQEILKGNVFQGYSEQPIHFPPSYKFDLHSDVYDSSEKQRTPSWTDRILFHSRQGTGVRGCCYDSCHSLQCSDHRAVYAVFSVTLHACCQTDGIPSSVTAYDRDIFRIAHQRRKRMAVLSHSLREATDGPSATTHDHNNRHVTSAFCTLL